MGEQAQGARPPESLKDRLATIIQKAHVEQMTSEYTAERILIELQVAIARADKLEIEVAGMLDEPYARKVCEGGGQVNMAASLALTVATLVARAETAERWKAEHLTVESWWLKVDEFIRSHPETLAGTSVAHRALTMLHERDALMSEHNALKAFLKPYVSK